MLATLVLSAAVGAVPVHASTSADATARGIEPAPTVAMSLFQQQPAERPPRLTPQADDAWGLRDGRFGPRMGDWEFTMSGGGITDHNFSSSTYSLNFSLGHFVTDHLEIAFRQGLNFSDVGASDFRGSSRAAVDWHFGEGRLRPFIGGSFGGIYGDRGDEWSVGPEAGVKWFVHPQTFLYGLFEYQWFFNRIRDIDDNARRGDFVLTLGIGFLF